MATALSKERIDPAERLRTAADLLGTQHDEGTSGPWTRDDPDPWGAVLEVRGPHHILVAVVSRADGPLLTTLRALAAPVAAWLRERAEAFEHEAQDRRGSLWQHETWPGCGLPKSGDPDSCLRGCRCFDHPLAVADAILGGAA